MKFAELDPRKSFSQVFILDKSTGLPDSSKSVGRPEPNPRFGILQGGGDLEMRKCSRFVSTTSC